MQQTETNQQPSRLQILWDEFTEISNEIGRLVVANLAGLKPNDGANFVRLQQQLAETQSKITILETAANEHEVTVGETERGQCNGKTLDRIYFDEARVIGSDFALGDSVSVDVYDVDDMTDEEALRATAKEEAQSRRKQCLDLHVGRKCEVDGYEESGAPEYTEGWHGKVIDVIPQHLSTRLQFLIEFGNGESFWYIATDLKFKD